MPLCPGLDIIVDERNLLLAAIKQTLIDNCHLADGDQCTLLALKQAVKQVDQDWIAKFEAGELP